MNRPTWAHLREVRTFNMRILVVILASILFSVTLTGCGEAKSHATEEKAVVLVPVQANQVAVGSIDAAYGSTAVLEAAEEANVAARQTGIVTDILVEEGDFVEQGQILAQLETEQLQLRLLQAQANLKQLANEMKRMASMHKQNMISADAYERVQFEYEAQKARTELAQLNLEHATIRAPISGVIANRYIKVGNMMKINDEAFKITDMSELHAVVHLPESEKAELKAGQTAFVQVASREAPYQGHIERISPVVDRGTGTIRVTVSLSGLEEGLRPGMFGRVGIIYDTHENTLLVPKEALVTEDSDAFVFIVEEGVAHKKMVETGFVNTNSIEIISGVKANDLVITMGQRNLKDQTQVEIIEAVAQL